MTTDSRLKTGTLTLGGESFAGQARSVKITPPKASKASATEEVLDGTVLSADTSDADPWTLTITAIQDFDNPTGLLKYLYDNEGDIVAYSWKPNATAPTFSGSVQVVAGEIGGDVATRLTSSIEMNCTAKPTWTPAV